MEGQSWFELTLECERTRLDSAFEILEAAGPVSVSLEDAGNDPQLEPEPGTTPLWPYVRIRALYERSSDAETVRALLQDSSTLTNAHAREIADRDWLAASREDIEPISIGSLWIGPLWTAAPPSCTVVRLEPGLAFGSGRHPTTRLCLERLAADPPVGIDVIDYGCGSGILAIAAAALGARHACALDIDPQARHATVENARINRVCNRLRVVAEPDELAPAPLVVANILAGPLVALASVVASLTLPGGALVLSGILDTQVDSVASAYRDAFDLHIGASSEGWVRLDGRRRIG